MYCINSRYTKDKLVVILMYCMNSRYNMGKLAVILMYCMNSRYTMDELAVLLRGLKNHAESYDTWTGEVRSALDARGEERLEFSVLKEFYSKVSRDVSCKI